MTLAIEKVNTSIEHKLQRGVLEDIANIVEFRSTEWTHHTKRMRKFAKIILSHIAVVRPEYKIDSIKVLNAGDAAGLHDIGKIMIPDKILLKPSTLTSEEYDIMKRHTIYGGDIVRRTIDELGLPMTHPVCNYYREIYNVTMYHHERFDGSGYPEGLKGDEIPIEAQVAGIVDVFDSLIDKRRYRESYSFDDAVDLIKRGEAGEFNPILVDALITCNQQIKDVIHAYK